MEKLICRRAIGCKLARRIGLGDSISFARLLAENSILTIGGGGESESRGDGLHALRRRELLTHLEERDCYYED